VKALVEAKIFSLNDIMDNSSKIPSSISAKVRKKLVSGNNKKKKKRASSSSSKKDQDNNGDSNNDIKRP